MKSVFLPTAILALLSTTRQHPPDFQPLAALLAPPGVVVISKPLNPVAYQEHWLIADDTITHEDGRYGYKPFAAAGISKRDLAELLANTQRVDTTLWQAQELPSIILVAKRTDALAPRATLAQLRLQDETAAKAMRKRIRRFNYTPPDDRQLYEVSRPILDRTGFYAAVIQVNGGTSMNACGRLLLFEKKAEGWHLAGVPKRWCY